MSLRKICIIFSLIILYSIVPMTHASVFSDSNQQPLPAEKAFIYQVSLNDKNQIIAHWDIAPGYYLYKDQFQFSAEDAPVSLGQPQYPKAQNTAHGTVYEGELEILIPFTTTTQNPVFVLHTRYQGCAAIGLCYPPIFHKTTLPLHSIPSIETPPAEQSFLVQLLSSQPLWRVLLTFFVLGIGLAFTPCVLPMIPILSSIIVGEAEIINTKRAFRLSVTYVLAMAIAYAGLGALAGAAGHNLQVMFQYPAAIGAFAGLFALLAFSMFGLYEIKLPQFIQHTLTRWHAKQSGGDFFGAAGMGFFSTFLVSPCLTPALAATLLYIGNTADIARGASVLFAMGLGIGMPLIAVGILEGRFLPKTGAWMQAVKSLFGVLLLLVAISMLDKLVARPLTLFLLGTVAIIFGMYSTVLFPTIEKKTHPGWWAFWRGVSLVLIAWGMLLLVGASAGSQEIYMPLKDTVFKSTPVEIQNNETVRTPESLAVALLSAKHQNKAAIVNFTATWCTFCKNNERFFEESVLVQQHANSIYWVKVDISTQNKATRMLMKQYRISGPPTLLFFDREGQERFDLRLTGPIQEEIFTKNLNAIVSH